MVGMLYSQKLRLYSCGGGGKLTMCLSSLWKTVLCLLPRATCGHVPAARRPEGWPTTTSSQHPRLWKTAPTDSSADGDGKRKLVARRSASSR